MNNTDTEVKYSFDTEYTLSDKFSLTSGLAGNYRKYDSPNVDFNYKEYRQKLYAFAKYAPIDQLQAEFGLGGEYIKTKNTNLSQDYFHLLPLLQINYQPNKNINLRTSYSTDMAYPSLSQLNPERMKIDNLMYQQGNTSLKSSLSHSVKVDLNYKELFPIVSRYQYAPNYISDIISHSSDEYKITYENIDYQELAFEATSDIPLSQHWMLSLAGTYYLSYAKYHSVDYHTDGWYLDADICYFSDNFTAQFGYHKNMDKRNKLQGFQEYNFDSWTLMLNKQFFNNRLGLTLNYLLPLKWGTTEKQTQSITTPTYNEILYTGVKPYRSALVFQLTYRFNSGKVRHQKHKSSVKREERIMRTFDF